MATSKRKKESSAHCQLLQLSTVEQADKVTPNKLTVYSLSILSLFLHKKTNNAFLYNLHLSTNSEVPLLSKTAEKPKRLKAMKVAILTRF